MKGSLVPDGARQYMAPLAAIMTGAIWLACESVYLPHVDDLFELVWGKAIADNAALPVHALQRFLTTPDYFQYAPRLHNYALAGFFRAFGFNVESLLLYRSTAFVLSAGIISAAAIRLKLPLVAVFFPFLLCLTMLHTGLRPEGTALLPFAGGFALLWGDEAAHGASSFRKRTLAKSLIVLAPLAAPSALAYGAALLIVSDLHDLRRRPICLLALEDAVALTVGILALGAMTGFDYAGFVRVYTTAGEQVVLHNDMLTRVGKGAALIAAAYFTRGLSRHAAFAGYTVGLATLLSIGLHNKISISVPLMGLATLALADTVSQNSRWREAVWGLACAIFSIVFTNQVIFALGSHADPESEVAVRTFAQQARAEGRTLLVDEIAAIHGLKLDVGDAFAWTWSLRHPDARPKSIEDIREGESWIVSTYTIHGWLRSERVVGFPENWPTAEKHLPGLPCLVGRNSCRLPSVRWGYYLVERRNGVISVHSVP
jgi:hypothetical protein